MISRAILGAESEMNMILLTKFTFFIVIFFLTVISS